MYEIWVKYNESFENNKQTNNYNEIDLNSGKDVGSAWKVLRIKGKKKYKQSICI